MLVDNTLIKKGRAMRYIRLGISILCLLACGAKADQFCIALAETYYEQVYCQLQAKAQTKNLPPFNQFKKNTEAVQASLLKRPAERNGIKLALPIKAALPVAAAPTKPRNNPHTEPTPIKQRITKIALQETATCELTGKQIYCAGRVYNLVGNRPNRRLAANVLSEQNNMSLPARTEESAERYLAIAYPEYIAKMCEIGLCGVTMTYGKFAYLYHDLQTKGLDFSRRFEMMFSFLKKDKATMGVSESTSIPAGLSWQDCSPLTDLRYLCEYQSRNYIFEAQ
jgi:hypothetical protein